MKRGNIKRIIAVLAVCAIFVMAGCKAHTVLKEEYYNDPQLLEKYFVDLDMDRAEFERIYPSEYIRNTEIGPMGPADPKYRGAVFLSEKEAGRLLNEYTWTKDDSPNPDLGVVNSSINWSDEWYVSEEFNEEAFRLGVIETIRFNGKDTIIFEFGTT